MNREQLTKEITESGLSVMDTETLLWYLEICTTSSEWMAFAKCDFVKYGPHSYQSHRRWFVGPKLLALSRGVK